MDTLANRYARALLMLASEDKQVLEYVNAIKFVKKTLGENPDLSRILLSRAINDEEKEKLLVKIFASYPLPYLIPFLRIILENHRVVVIDKILKEFISIANASQGIEEGIAYSTIPLTEDQIKNIEETISKKGKYQVELSNEIDESLIGGVKIVVRDRIYDGTIKNRLETLKKNLLERKIAIHED